MTATDEVVSLDHYRKAAAQKHGDKRVQIDDETVVTLRRPMRMPKEQRTAVFDAQERLQAVNADPEPVRKAKRQLRAAEDRRENLDPEKTPRRVRDEHDRRVALAEEALDEAEREHGTTEGTKAEQVVEAFEGLILTIADSEAGGRRLIDAAGGDLYILQEIVRDWQTRTEPGEASPSQD